MVMSPAIAVFDGVFSAAACSAAHNAAAARGLGHALYSRHDEPRSPLEHVMESFLSEMADDAPFVEYWSRQEWRHIECHADVDEKLAADGGAFRWPDHGHVLYLDVGKQVAGPTCLWEACCDDPFGGALTVVPAVGGRVLRFDGRLQHAVPCPSDVWLSPFTKSLSGSAEELRRSVLLFSTWNPIPIPIREP